MILAGDHIYKMDYYKLVEFHKENQADLTVGRLRRECLGIAAFRRHRNRLRTPHPRISRKAAGAQDRFRATSGTSSRRWASTSLQPVFYSSNFVSTPRGSGSVHDFGRDIIPSIIDTHRVFAFPFRDENRKQDAYWRDVGTLDAYYEANMDLISVDPLLNMYDDHWPIRTYHPNYPPPKFVFAEQGPHARRGRAHGQHRLPGSVVSGGQVERSIVGPNTRVNSFAHVEDSILFDGVDIGRHSRIRRAIIDRGVRLPSGTEVGFDREQDRARIYGERRRRHRHCQGRWGRPLHRATRAGPLSHGLRACWAGQKAPGKELSGGQRTTALSGSDWKESRRTSIQLTMALLGAMIRSCQSKAHHQHPCRQCPLRGPQSRRAIPAFGSSADQSTWTRLIPLLQATGRLVRVDS